MVKNIVDKDASEIIEQPILILCNNETWHHPDIETLLVWEDDGMNVGHWAYDDLIRIYLKNENGNYLCLVVTSPTIADHSLWFSDDTKHSVSFSRQFQESCIPWLHDLLEDIWSPNAEEFFSTPFGLQVKEFFSGGRLSYELISPDVGVSRDGPDSYSYST